MEPEVIGTTEPAARTRQRREAAPVGTATPLTAAKPTAKPRKRVGEAARQILPDTRNLDQNYVYRVVNEGQNGVGIQGLLAQALGHSTLHGLFEHQPHLLARMDDLCIALVHRTPVVHQRGGDSDALAHQSQQLEESLVVFAPVHGSSGGFFQRSLQQGQHDGSAIRKLAIQRGTAHLGTLDDEIQWSGHAMLGKHGIGRIQQLGAAFG